MGARSQNLSTCVGISSPQGFKRIGPKIAKTRKNKSLRKTGKKKKGGSKGDPEQKRKETRTRAKKTWTIKSGREKRWVKKRQVIAQITTGGRVET